MRCASSPGKCAASCSVMLTVISPAHSGGGDVDGGPTEEEDAPDADADGDGGEYEREGAGRV